MSKVLINSNNPLLFYVFIAFFSLNCNSAESNYSIYLDADFSGTKASSHSIKQGINTALAEVHYKIQGINFDIIIKDHRANSLRSKKNLDDYLKDENALLIFSGMHSPPILSNKSFINKNRILMLDPWAAAGPITRTSEKENWIFRLSIDDSKAGKYIVERAIEDGFNKYHLLLEDTGWGKSNEKTMTKALIDLGATAEGVAWFNWGLGINHAKLILRNIAESGAEVIFFVGNASEAKVFSKAMSDLPEKFRLPIRSHWGITGGNYTQEINHEERGILDLQFIQTDFSFIKESLSPFEQSVLKLAKVHNSNINGKLDIKAQTGFVHAYDLTKILITAINQSGLTGNRTVDKLAIHKALITLNNPVRGLLKTYNKPFSKYSLNNTDAHEALNIADYAMGIFGENGEVILINTTKED